jgi:predicted transcriptional regulator
LLIDFKLKEIISQKTSISRHSENITQANVELENNWKEFYKAFKQNIKKIDGDKSDEIIGIYNLMTQEFKASFYDKR